jgi:hypothetical protein
MTINGRKVLPGTGAGDEEDEEEEASMIQQSNNTEIERSKVGLHGTSLRV